jgi:hypothetical protein
VIVLIAFDQKQKRQACFIFGDALRLRETGSGRHAVAPRAIPVTARHPSAD